MHQVFRPQTKSLSQAAWLFGLVGLASFVAAQRTPDYYDGIDLSTSATARISAQNIISANTIQIGYTNTWTRLFRVDEDPDNTNNVILIYGGQSRPKATGGTSDGNNATGGWNREHVWPQGNYNSAEPMRSDLHALYPCDVDTNTHRSDQDFSTVTGPQATGFPDSLGNQDNNIHFEPADESKGKTARAMLYMDLRYAGQSPLPNLILQENTGGARSLRMGRRSTLLQWHYDFPPTAFEINRNAKVFAEQRNANPFVDVPELAYAVHQFGPVWVPRDGTTITVSSVDRAPVAVQSPGATNIPLVSMLLNMTEHSDYHVQSFELTKLGSLPDAFVSQVGIFLDVDRSGTITSSDVLVTTGTFQSGSLLVDFSARPFRLGQGRLDLLVTVNLANAIGGGPFDLGVRVEANSLLHSSTGGADINPIFPALSSGMVTINSNVTNGDTLSITSTDLAPISTLRGTAVVPMIRLIATPSAGEFDLAQLTVTRTGTATDVDAPRVTLHLDNNNNGVVDGPDQVLATQDFAGGLASLSLQPPFRLSNSNPRSLILSVAVSSQALLDRTIGLTLDANSILHSLSGGADTSGVNAGFTSGQATIIQTLSSVGATLIINEVYEGTAGNLKYVELKNVTTGTITLNGKQLRRYSNNNLTFASINLNNVNLPPGGYYVIANNSTDFSAAFNWATLNQFIGSISHNGNDSYTLFDSISGEVLDGFAPDNIGDTTNFALDIVAFRILEELPNDGAWGAPQQPVPNGNSPSGYWSTRVITPGNGNAATIGSPGVTGLPVSLSGFSIE
jgi:endonuclease I